MKKILFSILFLAHYSFAGNLFVNLQPNSAYSQSDVEAIKTALLQQCRGIIDSSHTLNENKTGIQKIGVDQYLFDQLLLSEFSYLSHGGSGTVTIKSVRPYNSEVLQNIQVIPDTTQICEN